MISKRFKEIRELKKLSQVEFADLLSVLPTTISKYERGEIKPSTDFLANLCRVFNININWLLTGQGEMFLNQNCVCEKSPTYNTDPEIDEMVELLKNMPAEKRHECLILCREKKLLFDIMSERIQKSKKQAG